MDMNILRSLFVLYTGVIVCAVFSSIQLCGVMMASALLLGLILVCIGLTSGIVTHFQCTNGSVCARDTVECNCTTNTGAIDWTISYRVLGSCNQSWIPVTKVNLNIFHNSFKEYGYNFTYNESDNSSRLTFHLNASESINVVCKNGNVNDNRTTNITDSGYNAKAPTNLTTTFNASGVTLEWEDTENNCTSTEYNVTIYDSTSTGVLTYYINKTALLINSNELNTTETYAYTVRGWNGQQSNISEPFTLAPIEVMSIEINNKSTCENNSCCVDITLNIILAKPDHTGLKHPSLQHYSICISAYNSSAKSYNITNYNKLEWNGSLKYDETYLFIITPMNNFSTGKQNNYTMTTEYQCQPPRNNGNGGLSQGEIAAIVIAVIIFTAVLIIILVAICCKRYQRQI
ncbi:PREDICTED: uncharacterized protein LOC109591228 [Amphimedon queenslandica]|uniref:Fibronectin type-III domain-containing protein n=2 Tax=Amphimedon queenslandica TaxID=400682 RepID=A0AAN0K063_AMPQE|nr:PREDICTED: uncharacterized protein LOC109591228 [Amphimedon queenslandica]|eukprot:XP_019862558.1 PREDICTED: uncharacterized protein LOC109591228 [Amphimedon queenslandica]